MQGDDGYFCTKVSKTLSCLGVPTIHFYLYILVEDHLLSQKSDEMIVGTHKSTQLLHHHVLAFLTQVLDHNDISSPERHDFVVTPQPPS